MRGGEAAPDGKANACGKDAQDDAARDYYHEGLIPSHRPWGILAI